MLHCPRCSVPLSISDCSENCCAPTNCQTKTMSGGIIQYPSSNRLRPSIPLYQNTSLDTKSPLHPSLDMKTCVHSNLGHSGGSCVTEMTACSPTRTGGESEVVREQLMKSHWKLQDDQRVISEQLMQLQITMLQKKLQESKLHQVMIFNNCQPPNPIPSSQIFLDNLPRPTTPPSPTYNHSAILLTSQKELAQSNWYYRNLDYQSSHALLANTTPGTFLLRDSQHPGCHFTLSFQRQKEGPTSIRIQLSGGKFFLDADEKIRSSMPRFDTVCKLVEYYLKEDRDSREGGTAVPMVLKKPLYNQVPSLQHLARLSINKTLLERKETQDLTNGEFASVLPQKLKEFLQQYPESI